MNIRTSAKVITYATWAAIAGMVVSGLSMVCQEPSAALLNLLSVVICSMSLGAFLVSFPMPD